MRQTCLPKSVFSLSLNTQLTAFSAFLAAREVMDELFPMKCEWMWCVPAPGQDSLEETVPLPGSFFFFVCWMEMQGVQVPALQHGGELPVVQELLNFDMS